MSKDKGIRWVWLKVMYIATIIISGGIGLGIIFAPNVIISLLSVSCAPATYGIVGSAYLAFALLSILGLSAPLKFVPILLFQLIYKVIWLIGVALPLLINGKFPADGIVTLVIFIIFIIGDLIAIPFPYIFAQTSKA